MLVLEINVDGMFAAAAVGCATTKKMQLIYGWRISLARARGMGG